MEILTWNIQGNPSWNIREEERNGIRIIKTSASGTVRGLGGNEWQGDIKGGEFGQKYRVNNRVEDFSKIHIDVRFLPRVYTFGYEVGKV